MSDMMSETRSLPSPSHCCGCPFQELILMNLRTPTNKGPKDLPANMRPTAASLSMPHTGRIPSFNLTVALALNI